MYSQRSIATVLSRLSRSNSTISEEIKQGGVRGTYDPKKAHHKAYVGGITGKYQGMKIVEHDDLRDFITKCLYDGQSPENIAGRIKTKEKHSPSIGKDAIYTFIASIYGRRIEYARNKKKVTSKGRGTKVIKLKESTFIDKRPKIINERKRLGGAEADFIVSGKAGRGILLTVANRKIRVSFIEQILCISIINAEKAFTKIKKRFPELRTITTDNDILFRHHKRLEKLLGVKIYFCHPYHSWEKGTIENTNKHIRKDTPKGSDISKYSKHFIKTIEEKLNRRFMKVLSHATPYELLIKARKRKSTHTS